MKQDDYFIKPPSDKPKNVILYAGSNFGHFDDECFVITDGVSSLPHAKEAEELTRDTALWAYKVVRQRPFYWGEKLEFLKRIFRSTNLTLWQKRRDPGFDGGLASALMTLLVIEDYFWIGSAGNCNSFLFRDGLIELLTKPDTEGGMITKAVGFARKQLIPAMRSEKLLENDVLFIATDSIVDFVSEDELRSAFESVGSTQESVQAALDAIIATAKASGSKDTKSACLVKRIVV